MSDLQTQLDALKKARASGVLRVTIANGMDVTYKSDAELSAAINALENEIARASGTGGSNVIIIRSSKGY
jgi:hypothetical protein